MGAYTASLIWPLKIIKMRVLCRKGKNPGGCVGGQHKQKAKTSTKSFCAEKKKGGRRRKKAFPSGSGKGKEIPRRTSGRGKKRESTILTLKRRPLEEGEPGPSEPLKKKRRKMKENLSFEV